MNQPPVNVLRSVIKSAVDTIDKVRSSTQDTAQQAHEQVTQQQKQGA